MNSSAVLVGVLSLLISIAASVFLIRAYLRTRLSGFLWLFFAVGVWPFVSRLIGTQIGLWIAVRSRSSIASSGGSLSAVRSQVLFITYAEVILGGILLITAVYLLDRQVSARIRHTDLPEDGQDPRAL